MENAWRGSTKITLLSLFSPSKKTIRIGCSIIKHATFYSRKKFHELLRNLKDINTNRCDIRNFAAHFAVTFFQNLQMADFILQQCCAQKIPLPCRTLLFYWNQERAEFLWRTAKPTNTCQNVRHDAWKADTFCSTLNAGHRYVRDRSSLLSWKLPGLHNENWVGCAYVR